MGLIDINNELVFGCNVVAGNFCIVAVTEGSQFLWCRSYVTW
jgi:hypothetical protein